MQAKITKSLLNQLKPGAADVWVWDSVLKGFGLRITPSDVRTYWVKYRMGGRESTTRKFKIGTHGTITPDQARTQAEQVLANIRLGVDPGAERTAAREPKIGKTVKDAAEIFLTRYASQLKSAEMLEGFFVREIYPRWAKRETVSIRRADVIAMLDEIVDSGRTTLANRIFSLVRKFFNWCLERGIVEATPCNGVRAPTTETSRDRVLDDDELRRLWIAAGKMAYPFGPWVRLLILTGQRRDEVSGMLWSELDLDAGMWALPKERVKNDRAHDIPLPAAALDILAGLPRDGSDFVFTTTGKTAISGYSKAKAVLDKGVLAALKKEAVERGDDPAAVQPLQPWVFHDFRRTVATNLAKIGIPVHVVERLLNHVSGTVSGIAAVYNRHSYLDERRQALEAWASRLDQIVRGTPANVTSLAAARQGRA